MSNHYKKPLVWIPLGLCQNGCGKPTKMVTLTQYSRYDIKGKPRKFCSEKCSHSYFVLPENTCQCGCDQPLPPGCKRFIPGHEIHIKKNYRICRACNVAKPMFKFPEYSSDFDYPCFECRMKRRQEELQAEKLSSGGPINYCKCGCGWITDIATETVASKGWKVGKPKPFFGLHGEPRKSDPNVRPIKVKRGYDTPCLERPAMKELEYKYVRGGGARRGHVMIAVGSDHPSERVADGYILAHEYAWEKEYGPLKGKITVLHKCGNMSCENIDHLYVVDNSPKPDIVDDNVTGYLTVYDVPPGYCLCGCGLRTAVDPRTGVASKFIIGHDQNTKWIVNNANVVHEKKPDIPEGYRRCHECQEVKPVEKFNRDDVACRLCQSKIRMAKYIEENTKVDRPQVKPKATPVPVEKPTVDRNRKCIWCNKIYEIHNFHVGDNGKRTNICEVCWDKLLEKVG